MKCVTPPRLFADIVSGMRVGPKDIARVAERAEAELIETVKTLRSAKGTGQEQGSEAEGPAVNHRRAAISVLMSRYTGAELEARLAVGPKGKVPGTVKKDVAWLERAERQAIEKGKAFDFAWSQNPMSTPKVLQELAARRAEAAEAAAAAIIADPSQPYDASNDCVIAHLGIEDRGLRAQVLADTLIQLRAKRRSEALMDAKLSPEGDAWKGQADGRIGSSGTVSAFEQRLVCKLLDKGDDREYALTRLVVANAAAGSVNGIFTSRNTIGLLPDYLGPGAYFDAVGKGDGYKTSIFHSIHQNYSANTPRAVDHYVRERAFTGGPKERRIEVLRGLVEAARAPDVAAAHAILGRLGYEVPEAAGKKTQEGLQKAIAQHLTKHTDISDLKTGLSAEGKIRAFEILLAVHRSVVVDRPTAADLEKELFYAGSAWKELAAFIHTLREGSHADQVEASGGARTALRKAFFESSSAFERQMLWRLDRKVELLSAEILGTAVERAEAAALGDPKALGECLLAVRSALRGVAASGFEALRARPKTAKTEDLATLLDAAGALLAKKNASAEDVRDLMARVFRSATEVADTTRGFFHRREGAIRFSEIDVDLDPGFSDNLVKESALHYLLSLSQRGMSFGVETKISADEIRFLSGMRVLSSTGPRVYERVLVASDAKALKKYNPPPGPNDLCVITSSNQKDLIYGGGLVLDAAQAGPGYSHASVFAKGHGISAIALPNLNEAISTFFEKAQSGQKGLYVDDRAGSFVIKPLQSALDEGLLKKSDVEKLRPGFNLSIDYFDVTPQGERVLAAHSEAKISDHHSTRNVELIVPDLTNELGIERPVSFESLAKLPLDVARQYAGEKGAILARMSAHPTLRDLGLKVPGGAVIPPSTVADLLKAAAVSGGNLYDYQQAAIADPSFCADPQHRLAALEKLQKTTVKSLTKLLISQGKPTKAGRELLSKLEKHPALKGKTPWILRSSFTGEDRPYKSGAGQYSSFPNMVTQKQRLEGIIGVIASAWNTGAVESNLRAGIHLEHVWPSVVVQRCLNPTVSGVAVSRGTHGGFNEVSYQAKPKFGGGVDGGLAEEGILRSQDTSLTARYKDRKDSLLSAAQQQKLRAAILAIEEDFNSGVEPGKQFAVDVEWAFTGDELHILQARVITGV